MNQTKKKKRRITTNDKFKNRFYREISILIDKEYNKNINNQKNIESLNKLWRNREKYYENRTGAIIVKKNLMDYLKEGKKEEASEALELLEYFTGIEFNKFRKRYGLENRRLEDIIKEKELHPYSKKSSLSSLYNYMKVSFAVLSLLFSLSVGSGVEKAREHSNLLDVVNPKIITKEKLEKLNEFSEELYKSTNKKLNFGKYVKLELPIKAEQITREKWFNDTLHYAISSPFGVKRNRSEFYPNRKGTYFHGGIDIYSGRGKSILSPIDGVIIKSEKQPNFGYGNLIQVKKENVWVINYKRGELEFAKELVIVLAHLKNRMYRVGDSIKKGEVVGKIGYFGNDPSKRHLHYEIRINGKKVNPADYYPEGLKCY